LHITTHKTITLYYVIITNNVKTENEKKVITANNAIITFLSVIFI